MEAIGYYKTHKEESFKVMSKYLRIQDREVLEENFQAYDHSVRPYATHEELELPIQEVGKSNPNVLKADPSQFVDHSIPKNWKRVALSIGSPLNTVSSKGRSAVVDMA